MKRYREYMVYILKSVSITAFSYIYFYVASIIFFDIYLDETFFFIGIFAVLVSLIFHMTVEARCHRGIDRKWSIIFGLLFSAIICAASLGYFNETVRTSVLFMFSILLWKLGYDISGMGLQYDEYKNQFILCLRVLLVPVAISILLNNPAAVNTVGRYAIIFFVLGLIMLKNSRELMYFRTRSSRANIIGIAVNIMIVLVLMLISSEKFTALIAMLALNAIGLLDKLVSGIIYVISYPIGQFISFIVNWLSSILKFNLPEVKTQENPENEQPLSDATGWNIPQGIETAAKILVFLILVYMMIRIYRYYSKKKMNEDFTESKESIFSFDGLGRGIRNVIAPFTAIFKTKPKPVTLAEKIRYAYNNFLELNFKHGIYMQKYETHKDIERKGNEYVGEGFTPIDNLTDIYEKVRYSQNEPDDTDYKSAVADLEEIKGKYKSRIRER